MKYDMTNLKPRYRFTRIFRGYQVGQMVPDSFDFGVLDSLLVSQRIERVPENAPVLDPALGTPRGEPAPRIAAVAPVAAVEEDDDWEVEEKPAKKPKGKMVDGKWTEIKQTTKAPADKMMKPNTEKVKRK